MIVYGVATKTSYMNVNDSGISRMGSRLHIRGHRSLHAVSLKALHPRMVPLLVIGVAQAKEWPDDLVLPLCKVSATEDRR